MASSLTCWHSAGWPFRPWFKKVGIPSPSAKSAAVQFRQLRKSSLAPAAIRAAAPSYWPVNTCPFDVGTTSAQRKCGQAYCTGENRTDDSRQL